MDKHSTIHSTEEKVLEHCSRLVNHDQEYGHELLQQLNNAARKNLSIELVRQQLEASKASPELIKEYLKIISSESNKGKELDTATTTTDDDTSTTPHPTLKQYYLVLLNQMVPFIGFGFMDNSIMIVAGDQIDATLGITLGISTMAAAGLGNLLSDVVGVCFGGMIEATSGKLGIPASNLTPSQYKLPKVRVTVSFAQCLGITIGCLLGMLPLLWMDQHDRNLRAIFQAFDEDEDGFIEIEELERCMKMSGIHFREEVLQELIKAVDTSKDGKIEYEEFKAFMLRLRKIVVNNSMETNLKRNKFVKWIHDVLDS